MPLGFDNSSFHRAIQNCPPFAKLGERFDAFVTPEHCLTFRKKDKDRK